MLAGRGFGKTRAGAEWVREQVETGTARRIALVAPTLHDARAVMVEGDSGLLSVCPPWFAPNYEPSKRTLTWPNGAVATLFGAEEPERLRGPQHDVAWCDELCAWKSAEATFDMLMFGLRLGRNPKLLATTTPKPMPLLKRLVENPKTRVTKGTTYDNLKNLAPGFARDVVARYNGTRLGRQELMAEILEDTPGALWTRGALETCRIETLPAFTRIVVAVDPPASIGENADECGIVAAGLTHAGTAVIIADESAQGLSPHGWAAKAVALYDRLKADRIVAETNMGGAMVEAIIREVDPAVSYRAVHATRAKIARAEPVAALYEQNRVQHFGGFALLEDQMCNFTGVAKAAGTSPDRLDALVWALTDLMLGRRSDPNIRKL
jgi:phage terminase large subunit-like protein